LTQHYEDGMTIAARDFLTMTCNSFWSEISSQLQTFLTALNRPNLLTKIFRAKFEQWKQNVIKKGVIGKS